MRRKIVITLLALGTAVGYGSGIAHAIAAHHGGHDHRGPCSGWHSEDKPSEDR